MLEGGGDITRLTNQISLHALSVDVSLIDARRLALVEQVGLGDAISCAGEHDRQNRGSRAECNQDAIANADPAADYPSACLGLGATIETDKRKIEADKFFTGMFETALKAGEIITAVHFPIPKKSAHQKFPNPASRYALTGVFVSQDANGKVRVGVTGAAASAFRATDFEAALSKDFSAKAISGIKISPQGLMSDMHATAAYRAHLISVLAGRAVTAAN